MSNDNLLSSDDDDLLLEFSSRPPRFSQVPSTQTDVASNQQEVKDTTQILLSDNTKQDGVTAMLTKAKGEASMLRDKISFLDQERNKEKRFQQIEINKLKNSHALEENNLKQSIQRLEDEKKFLIMGAKTASTGSAVASSPATPTSMTSVRIRSNQKQKLQTDTQNSSPIVKKRKLEELSSSASSKTNNNFVPLNPNRVTLDETGEFFDSIISHKIIGSELTTMEILDKLKLESIKNFQSNTFIIPEDDSIGKSLFQFLLLCKKSLPLDKCIDILLENIAFLIKEISFNPSESRIAVPFLIAIMYQIIIFRPSAVHTMALKDLFLFFSDLIKKYQHVIKQPLHPVSPDLMLEPQIFQFELINNLTVFNSFDLLEISLRILQSHSSMQKRIVLEFFDSKVLRALEQIYKLALPISFKPNLKVVFNMIEILSIVANISETLIPTNGSDTDTEKAQLIESSWWTDCITRLYHILSKGIKNVDVYDDSDLSYFFNNKYHDCFGLIRNIGENRIGNLISKLIDPNILQSGPKVISKDEVLDLATDTQVDFQFEYWSIALKNEILNLFDTLLSVYPEDRSIGNGEMLSCLVKLISREQEKLLQRNIGQDSPNTEYVPLLIEHLITTIYQMWTNNRSNIDTSFIKGIENELLMSLWRIIASGNETVTNQQRSSSELKDHRLFVDKFYELSLGDQVTYYEDAFENMPEYLKDELKNDLEERCSKIMQISYDEVYVEMAKKILESELCNFGSMEDVDSLYVAMGL